MIIGAFAEEIIFRGVLLPKFIKRYGLNRGIFLTGIAWTIIHFCSDSYSRLSVGEVLLHFAYRVLGCLALNYVFAWMTLRWNSIIPAGLAHTASNIIIMSGLAFGQPWDLWLRILLWATLAAVLFRFWPVAQAELAEAEPPISPLQPAI